MKTVYHKEFDEELEEYNKKQTRQDRKIEDYFEHVAGKEQDMAVKANKTFEKEYTDKKEKLEFDISYLESMWRISKSLSEMDSRESKHI